MGQVGEKQRERLAVEVLPALQRLLEPEVNLH
jgi:hypothetical protein